MLSPAFIHLAQSLVGEFDNHPQAMEQPAWFVHLRLWHRPLPHLLHGNLALFAEQANALYPDQPYRQRIIVLQQTTDPDIFQAQYLALKHPDQYRGAGAKPDALKALDFEQMDFLPDCLLTITHQNGKFSAQPAPDARCCFQYDGKTRQVVLGFEVGAGWFRSYDRGVDPETGQGLWGALMGPYEFQKCADFAADLPLEASS